MSNYKDFVSDYPARCRDLLVSMEATADELELKVTFLLMVASAGFVVPLERLKDGNASQDRNNKRHKTAAETLDGLWEVPFLKSPFAKRSVYTWRFGYVENKNMINPCLSG